MRNLLIVLFAVLAVIFFANYKHYQKKYNNDITVAQDTVSVYKNKCNELYRQSEFQVTSINELKKTNSDLAAEVKKLKDNPVVVIKTEYVTVLDTIKVSSDVTADTLNKKYDIKFSYDDKWCEISGKSIFSQNDLSASTTIDRIMFTGSIYTDIIEKNKNLYLISKSDNPYLKINNTEGYMLSPEQSSVLKSRFKKPWGLMAGAGVSATVVNNAVKIYPTVSVIVGYKFIDF